MKYSNLCLIMAFKLILISLCRAYFAGLVLFLTHATHLFTVIYMLQCISIATSLTNMTSLGNKRLKFTLPSDYNRNTFAN